MIYGCSLIPRPILSHTHGEKKILYGCKDKIWKWPWNEASYLLWMACKLTMSRETSTSEPLGASDICNTRTLQWTHLSPKVVYIPYWPNKIYILTQVDVSQYTFLNNIHIQCVLQYTSKVEEKKNFIVREELYCLGVMPWTMSCYF